MSPNGDRAGTHAREDPIVGPSPNIYDRYGMLSSLESAGVSLLKCHYVNIVNHLKLEDRLDYSSLDYTEQNNAEQKNTVQNNTEQNNTEQKNTVQNNTEQNNTEQKNTVQNNTEQNNTEQKNTVQGGKWSHLSAITRSENIFEILSLQGQHLI